MKVSYHLFPLLALVAAAVPGLTVQAATLGDLLVSSQAGDYQAPPLEELARAELLFQRTFADTADTTLAADWAALGFQCETISQNDRTFTVIRERPDQLRGRGFYAFAAVGDGAPILQAPHPQSDLHTGVIVLRLFEEGQFAAGAWATVARSYEGSDGTVNADMAHLPSGYFIAFSTAAVRARPTSAIIQWHGFAGEKRTTAAGRQAGAIVSAGQDQPTPAALQTARCLSAAFTEPVLLFATQVAELGGTTNQIGKTLRALGSSGFVHVELGRELRDGLSVDAQLQQQLGRCVARVKP